MRRLVLALALCAGAACSDDGGGGSDGDDGGDAVHDGGGDRDARGDDAGARDAAVPSARCGDYCESIMATCTGTLAQYKFMPTCLASCALFPAGAEGADSGDSVACRLTHLALAEEEAADPHCRHAGPSGGGVCGAPCDAYCDLVMAVCDLYADDGECMEVCSGFPDTVLYSIDENRGDTVQCRVFHATMASAFDGHCGTASAESGPCSDE